MREISVGQRAGVEQWNYQPVTAAYAPIPINGLGGCGCKGIQSMGTSPDGLGFGEIPVVQSQLAPSYAPLPIHRAGASRYNPTAPALPIGELPSFPTSPAWIVAGIAGVAGVAGLAWWLIKRKRSA